MNNNLYSGPNRLYLVFNQSFLGFFDATNGRLIFAGADVTGQIGSTITISGTESNNGTFAVDSTSYVDGTNTVFISSGLTNETRNFTFSIRYLIREPLGWKEAQISIDRNEHHGFNVAFPSSDIQLKFHDKKANGFTYPTTGEPYFKAKELIDNEIALKGGDVDFALRLEYLFGGVWYNMPEIKLDLSKYDKQKDYSSCTAKTTSFEETIENLLDTKVNLFRTTDLNGDAIEQLGTESVWFHSKVLRRLFSGTWIFEPNTSQATGVGTGDYANISPNKVTRDEINKYSINSNGIWSDVLITTFDIEESGTYQIDLQVTAADGFIFPSTGYSVTNLQVIIRVNETEYTASKSTSTDVLGVTSAVFTYSNSLDLKVGDSFYLLWYNADVSNKAFYFTPTDSFIDIVADTQIPGSLLDSYPIYSTIEKVTEVITGDPGTFASDFFSSYSDLHLVNGNILKGSTINQRYAPSLTAESAFRSLDAIFNTGWNIENQRKVNVTFNFDNSISRISFSGPDYTDEISTTFTVYGTVDNDGTFPVTSKSYTDGVNLIFITGTLVDGSYSGYFLLTGNQIRLEESAFFYNQSNQVIDITAKDIFNYSEKIATEYIYNQAKFGYPDLRYDELNTTDEFNTEADYLLLSRSIKNAYIKISDWKTQGYDIEFLRRQALKTETTAFEEDGSIYLMQTFTDSFSTTVSFSSTDDSITVLAGVLDRFKKGRKFTISGSASNDGAYTFNEGNYEPVSLSYKIFLNESVVTETSVVVTVTMFYKATEADEKFATLSGVISPETVFNAKLSPARNYLRHASWLNASQHYKDSNSSVINTNYKLNGDMVSKLSTADTYYDPLAQSITQNQDFTLLQSNKNTHWVIPIISEFTVNLSFDEVMSIMDAAKGQGLVPYGYISHLNWNRTETQSWLLSLKGKPTDNEYTLRVLWWNVGGLVPPEDYWIDGDLSYVIDSDLSLIPWHL